MALIGMSRDTGQALTGIVHLKQSIRDILSTPLGSRRMRPEYGSEIPRYVDLPINKGWISGVQAEAARAIGRWEPRIRLSAVRITSVVDGRIDFVIEGQYEAAPLLLEVAL